MQGRQSPVRLHVPQGRNPIVVVQYFKHHSPTTVLVTVVTFRGRVVLAPALGANQFHEIPLPSGSALDVSTPSHNRLNMWRDMYCPTTRVVMTLIDHTSPYVDRKSTRLNSSHVKISYAVFCLKKKK